MKNQNHTSHRTLHTSQKGITLIALIITIIVMLILVGVTINVALNGGLFDKAKDAAVQTEEKTIYEQIVAAMELKNNGKIDAKGTYNASKAIIQGQGNEVAILIPGAETEITEDTVRITFNVKGKNGVYTYTITDKEIVIGTLEKVYSFTLNELGDCFVDDDSFINFELSKLWEVVGEDLSQNSNYIIELGGSTGLITETDNGKIKDYILVNLGEVATDENTQYLIGAVLDEDVFLLKVLGVNGEELGDKLTEFLNEFGDVEFRFVETSSIEIPE